MEMIINTVRRVDYDQIIKRKFSDWFCKSNRF
jgi:hypothetical protein